ncbi:MAG: hypothetical protein U0984_16060 [Prosthecobacter sp.]|nr:hypothetical protein [Prosthecobacter sp.]
MTDSETRIQTVFVAALLLLGSLSLPLTGCREKTLGEKVGDKIDDALDQRPAETIRDKVEDIKK